MKPDESYQNLTDEDLVAQIVKKKNTILFGELYDRYIKQVYNKCYGFAINEEEAKDLTQDVFIKLFINLGKYKRQETSKFSSWLFVFVYNFCVNYVNRNKSKRVEKQSNSIDHHANLIEETTDEILFEIRVERLEQVLELIPPEDKSILLLKYKEDLSIRELSKLLEVGESAIKMRLKRAKAKVLRLHNKKYKSNV